MRDWQVSTGLKGHKLHIFDYSRKNRARLTLLGAWDFLDAKVTRHWLCASGCPDFVWSIPLGRPRYDDADSDFLVNSLGSGLFNLNTKLYSWVYRSTDDDLVKEISLSEEEFRAIAPDLAEIFQEE